MSVREIRTRTWSVECRDFVPVSVTVGGNVYLRQTNEETGATDEIVISHAAARDLAELLEDVAS